MRTEKAKEDNGTGTFYGGTFVPSLVKQIFSLID